MKNKFSKLLSVVVALCIFYGAYLFANKLWSIFTSINPALAAAMLTTSGTVIVSVLSILFAKRQEHKISVISQLREKKIPVYEQIISYIFKVTFAHKLGKQPPTDDESIEFFAKTTQELVIWGSHDMIKAFSDFRIKLIESTDQGKAEEILNTVEDLLFAVRKDLGHNYKNVKRGDILRLYVNDYE